MKNYEINRISRDKIQLILPENISVATIIHLDKTIHKMGAAAEIEIDFKRLQTINSTGIGFIYSLNRYFTSVNFCNIRPNQKKILALFPRVEPRVAPVEDVRLFQKHIERVGSTHYRFFSEFKGFLFLLADQVLFTLRYLVKREGVYPGDIIQQLYLMGFKSFPIVSLIAFLVGVTIAITSAEQLNLFGADIYLADLIGYGMLRELVPMMTGIILAGKVGASITAEISSMKVLEELDALKTMGLEPVKFLMVSRLIAISLAVPILVTIADVIGIFGGVLVGRFYSGIPVSIFLKEMFTVATLPEYLNGLLKTLVFGWVVVIGSGYKGFSARRDAVGIGISTTESVVLSISLIIVIDCIFAFLLY